MYSGIRVSGALGPDTLLRGWAPTYGSPLVLGVWHKSGPIRIWAIGPDLCLTPSIYLPLYIATDTMRP